MGRIRQSHYSMRVRSADGASSGSVRIAVLADMHNSVYRSDIESLRDEIRSLSCDIILSAGDLVLMKNGRYATDGALRLVGELAKDHRVYVADGNHESRMKRVRPREYELYDKALSDAGVTALHNSCADIREGGIDLHIAGLELDYRYFRRRYHMELSAGKIRKLLSESCDDRFNILLAHHPRYFSAYAEWGADLVLSGHLHGGIVRLPVLGGVVSPDPELFPHFDHGMYEEGESKMIVSAGLGSHSINLRINNPAELVVVDLIS